MSTPHDQHDPDAPPPPPPNDPSLPPPVIYQPSYDDSDARPVPKTDWSAPENAPQPPPPQMPDTAYDPEKYGGYVPKVDLRKREIEDEGPKPWSLAGTIGWLLCSWLLLFALFWFAWLVGAAMMLMFDTRELPKGVEQFIIHGVFLVVAPLCAGLAMIRGFAPSDYLNLKRPGWLHIAVGIVATLGLYFASAALIPENEARLLDRAMAKAIRWDMSLVFLSIAVLVFVPLWEELLHRGFLYKGVELSPLKWPGAILITAAAFAFIHLPDGSIAVTRMFAFGLLLGAMRAWSQSTWLTVGLHALWNATVIVSYLSLSD